LVTHVSDAHLVSIWSTLKILKLLGSSNDYLQLNYLFYNFTYLTNKEINNQKFKKKIFENIIQERISNLKQIAIKIQSVIQKIKYKDDIKTKGSSKLTKLSIEFAEKIKDLKITDKNGKNEIFEDLDKITKSIFSKSISKDVEYEINTRFLEVDIVREINNNDNLMTFYIINNLIKLIDYNDGIDKTYISFLIPLLIHNIFEEYYVPLNNTSLRRFEYKVNSKAIVQDENIHVVGIYQELVNEEELNSDTKKESEYDVNEETNALDVDDYDEEEDDFYYDNNYTDSYGE